MKYNYGKEFRIHAEVNAALDLDYCFARLHRVGERRPNKAANDLAPQSRPKRKEFTRVPPDAVQRVSSLLNRRQRKVLSLCSPVTPVQVGKSRDASQMHSAWPHPPAEVRLVWCAFQPERSVSGGRRPRDRRSAPPRVDLDCWPAVGDARMEPLQQVLHRFTGGIYLGVCPGTRATQPFGSKMRMNG